MQLFLDSANTQDILDRYKSGLIAGITTNPTLIRRSGRDPHSVYNELADNGVLDISMEVIGDTEEELFSNAIGHSKEYDKHATIKLPCSMAGIRACRRLSDLSIRTNITLVFNASQAILAALAGATYVSPFVGRMDDNSLDGIHLISEISHVFKTHNVKTKILSASIRDVQSIGQSFAAGANICTIPTSIFDKMADHVLTSKGIERFNEDARQNLS